jgi:hypothetical protein
MPPAIFTIITFSIFLRGFRGASTGAALGSRTEVMGPKVAGSKEKTRSIRIY